MSIADGLNAHFLGGAVVCPYARITHQEFFADDDLTFESVGRWMSVLYGRFVAVVYAAGEERNFDEARAWCHATFLRLRDLANGGRIPDPGHLQEPKFLPYLVVGSAIFYTIGMGPQYPAAHPRHAPHLCLVSVNEAAIREVPEDKRLPIQREVAKRMGVVYDADEVWLPFAPKAKERL